MLTITVPAAESFDEAKSEFIDFPEVTLSLEHSLVSLSSWESKWEKSFLGPEDKTSEETVDYIRCMTLTHDVDPEVYSRLSNENLMQVQEYITKPMTATTFTELGKPSTKKEIITAEIIYHWLVAFNIPFETQTWHLNRLLTLVKVVNLKTTPQKKMGRAEQAAHNRRLNEERMRKYNTSG